MMQEPNFSIKYIIEQLSFLIWFILIFGFMVYLMVGCATPFPKTDINYVLSTPKYGIQVSNKADVSNKYLLDMIDKQTEQFMNCQFGGDTVINRPLNQLRVLVVNKQYKCDLTRTGICRGSYNWGKDLLIFMWSDFPKLYRHELAHRYSYTHKPDNFPIYEKCIKGE